MRFSAGLQNVSTFRVTKFRQSESRRGDENRLVPLINVVFLMLIFFLLVGTVRSPLPESVVPPVSSANQARSSHAVTVTVDKQLQIFINDRAVSANKVSGLADQVQMMWPDRVGGDDIQFRRLEIRADKALTMRRLGPIISVLSQAGADELSLITQR